MKKHKLSEKQITAILGAFRDALDHGPWASSALLRVLGKKLLGIYETLENKVDVGEKAVLHKKSLHHSQKKPAATHQEVFVALYSSDGTNLKSWEHILANLPKQMVSRPIYANEADIKQVVKERSKQNNEGYVAIYIDKSNVLTMPSDRAPKDRLGTALLTIKDNALLPEHIIRFVHVTGVYTYTNGRLKKDLSPMTDS
jgi:intracellular multiplication protein IcmQ